MDLRPAAGDTAAHNSPLAPLVRAGMAGRPWSDALGAIRSHLGMEVAFISEFTAGQRVFRHVDAAMEACPVREGGADPLEDTYCQRVADGRLPELIRDAGELEAAADLSVTRELPVGAHLSVPIRLADGQVYGTFCCFSTSPDHSLNDRDLATMRIFADLAAAEIERDLDQRRRSAEALARLRAVIAGDGLLMVFQPIVNLDGCRPIGFEALSRFRPEPSRGPDVWFAEAAAAGLGVELELAAVGLALDELHQLPSYAYLAVNVSPSTATSGGLEDALLAAGTRQVVLEITEHDVIEAYDDLEGSLTRLRKLGMRVAVDDAGAGYASFRHILRLAPDIIKLDMTLTRDIDRDPARRALASALIGFARETGSSLVAEGVETDAELTTLRRLGVTTAQGYHVGRPKQASAMAGPASRNAHG